MTDSDKALLPPQNDRYPIIDLVVNGVDSPHSKRAYSRALLDFMEWYEANGRQPPAFAHPGAGE